MIFDMLYSVSSTSAPSGLLGHTQDIKKDKEEQSERLYIIYHIAQRQ